MSLLRIEASEHVTTLVISNAQQRNALSSSLLRELIDALVSAEARASRALIRAEAGVTTWSAGHDISELPSDGTDPLTWSNPLEELFRTIRRMPFPVIAAVEGGVWGGACDLVLTCDLVVAMRTASFAITPVKLGVPYNTAGVAHFVSGLPLNVAKEMFFTANPLTAEQMAAFGVVNRLVSSEPELTSEAGVLATRIASLAPLAIGAIKAEMTALTDASPLTSSTFEHLTSRRNAAWRSDDYREGIAAFNERRTPNFTGK
jgi:methylmalonyl-CoA decarboxylase